MTNQTSITLVDGEIHVSVTTFFESEEEVQEMALKAFVRSPYKGTGKYVVHQSWPYKHELVQAAWQIVKHTGKFSHSTISRMAREEIVNLVELIRKTS